MTYKNSQMKVKHLNNSEAYLVRRSLKIKFLTTPLRYSYIQVDFKNKKS